MFVERVEGSDLGTDLLATVHQCESPLAAQFFSKQNMARIHTALQTTILRKTGYAIGKQSDEELGIIMRAQYILHARNGASDVRGEVERLNAIVLSEIVPMVGTGISQHLGYLRDASTLPVPLDRAKNMSIKGQNTFELFRGM